MLISLTGCWDYRPLESLSFTVGIGVDQEETGEFIMTMQFINTQGSSGGKQSHLTEHPIYQGKGKTIQDAFSQATLHVPHYVFMANTQVVIIGENVAKQGLKQTLDYLYRFQNLRPDFSIVIARHQKAKDLLQVTPHLSNGSSEKISSIARKMEQGKTFSIGTHLTFLNLLTNISTPDKGYVLNSFKVFGNTKIGKTIRNTESIQPPAQLSPTGLAVFQNDILQGWLTIPESVGYNYILGTAHLVPETLSCSRNKKVLGQVVTSTSKRSVKRIGSRLHARVKVQAKVYLTGIACKKELSPENITSLEIGFKKQIEHHMRQTMHQAQHKFKLDIFDFSNAFAHSYPKEWLYVQKKWNAYFTKMKVTYDVHVKIEHIIKNI